MTNLTNPLDEFEPCVWEQSSIHAIIARVMARPDATTFKFDGDMVRASKPLWDWAKYLVDHYVGPFSLMADFRMKQRLGWQLSEGQLKVALNTLLNTWRQSLKAIAKAQVATTRQADAFDVSVDLSTIPSATLRTFNQDSTPAYDRTYPTPQDLQPKVTVQQIPTDGTYTYVSGEGDYRVVRFATPRMANKQPGKITYISYQYGPDNDCEFAKCGRITDLQLTMWKQAYLKGDAKVALDYTQRADLVEAIVFICSLEKDDLLKSGEAYALRSGNCFMCGKTLTVPSSISAGIGPVCAKRWGI